MNLRAACTAYRITQALHLARTLSSMVELTTPLPPRRQSSRDQTLVTSLRVIARELEKAVADLDAMTDMEVRRVG
jgi:hypothetical protein